jgi:hypothetical protein
MRALTAVAAISLAMILAAPASAFEGGGRSPSEAPLIAVGQHYTGQLNNHRSDANYNGDEEVALWRLPPVTTHDVVTVDWHGVPFTHSPGYFPVDMILAQGIDDFNWGSIFGNAGESSQYHLSGSGSARTEIVAQATDSASYLEFYAYANETSPTEYETYPYDFTVEPILHYLAVAITPAESVSANGILSATANLATGLPVPDGVAFVLSVAWREGGIASYTGISSGGVVNFQLALPETAWGKNTRFIVSHPADGTYQAVNSPSLHLKVTKPTPTPPSRCVLAKRRARSLARRLKRLRRHARRARGRARRRLRHRAHRTKHKLHSARHKAASLCV